MQAEGEAILWNDNYARDCHATLVARNDVKDCRLWFLPQQFTKCQPSPSIPLPTEREVRTLSNGRGQGEGHLKKTQKSNKLYLNQTTEKAFTLAEVLITLVVIGIIAAITVPMIHANYKKQETVTRLKKVYSTLSQTTNRAIADNGPIATWVVESGTIASKKFMKKYLIPYLNVNKNCETTSTGDCAFDIKTLKGNTFIEHIGYPRFILNDGTMILVRTFKSSDNSGQGEFSAGIYVDINGTKKPNTMGKDIFYFLYIFYSNSLQGRFVGVRSDLSREDILSDTTYGCNKNASVNYHANKTCATLIMKDGWEIKDDYPW